MKSSAALALLVAALVLTPGTYALDPSRALTQARLSVWTSENGLPQNTVGAIAQTRDGYLWAGTEEGLARFDGVRFVVSDRQTAPALRSAFISSVFETPDGTLWIGTYGGGLARMRGHRIDAFRPDLLGSDRIREMVSLPGGRLLIATAGGGLLEIHGNDVTRFTTRNGLPTDRIWAIESDGAGGWWIATHGGGVVRWRDARVTGRIAGLPNEFARALLRDGDGTLWIATDGGGLVAWRDGAIVRRVTTRDGLPNDFVRTLLRDRDGSLWIGTDGGLARLNGARVEAMVEGLPRSGVVSMTEDREGNLWVGTTGGLVRLRDTRVLSLTRKEGLPADTIRPILEDRAGRVWAGTEGGGLCRVAPAPVQCFTKRDGLPHDNVYALAESRDGDLWVGTDGGGVAQFRDGRFTETIDTRRGLTNDRVRAIVENANGDLWVSSSSGLTILRGGQTTRVKEFDDRQLRPLLALPNGDVLVGTDGTGLWRVSGSRVSLVAGAGRGLENDRVFSLAHDGANGVWIGMSGGGLAHLDLRDGSVKSLTRREGLYDDVVFQVVDAGADLWLTSNRGVYRVPRARVLEAMAGRLLADLTGTVYGVSDGLPSSECVGASPGAIRTRDGHVWIATARGIGVIDPAAYVRNTVPPPVHVEEVLIDGDVAPSNGTLRIPPGAQRIEIRYTAVSLRAPERVTFRYLLEGYDSDWVDAGASRVAHYTKLAPGSYTFRVVATNEDGVRSMAEARMAMTVEPRWFETWWARVLALLLIAAVIWAGIRWRLSALHAQRMRALSYMDGLTGVANRRRFDEALAEACATSAKTGQPLSLVLLDLDHFKRLNDTHGHLNGDEALRSVAALLAERTKARGGLVARVGGEEFAWLLPGVPLDAATAEAEAVRLKVRNAAIQHAGSDAGVVTASLGVAAAANGLTPTSLVAAADTALYRAKARGRDRVEAEPMVGNPDDRALLNQSQ